GQRHSIQPSPRRGLSLDRVHAVHTADATRRGGAGRPLGRVRQAGMWHSSRRRKERMTEHIYGHEHPESGQTRGGGFALWFTGLSGSGKTTIAHLAGPELDQRGAIV